MQRVDDLVDVEAPCEDVFGIVVDIERRMQLSPLWGLSILLGVAANYPKPGSSYRVRVTDAPFGIAGGTSQSVQSAFAGLVQVISWKIGQSATRADWEPDSVAERRSAPDAIQAQTTVVEKEQEYIVAEYEPPRKFIYYLNADCRTIVTWRFQSIPRGTRINYEEVFCDENAGGEDFLPTVRGVIREWLVNIKRYGELRGSRGRLFLKWFLDRFFLKLRPDQRRTVLLILFMQAVALVTFVVAAIGLGIAGLLF
ncbi:MAG: hypothetical protein C4583_18540 [Anaerolineaceae bacterium]|nr:MAG: hypothetical protein C4583_18540 [Anaerolineaceae bacterium]